MSDTEKSGGAARGCSEVVPMPLPWRHLGGGCGVCSPDDLPCDDDYEERGTGRRMRFKCSEERHFQMPREIRDMPRFLAGIAGRRDIRHLEASKASDPEGVPQT